MNDVQVEGEDYIIDRAGKCGAVTIATNTAGRGTDIKLEKMAIESGGLHVIIGFFPVNLRVECQNLGRAGRQGQQGSCQIIFSSEIFAGPQPIACDEIMKIIYDTRTERVRKYSEQRLAFVQKEHLIFDVLTKYFNYYRQMRAFLESPRGEKLIRINGGEKLGNHYDSESILSDLSKKWSQFYTRLSNGEIELNDNLFDYFKNQYELKMSILTNAFNECIQKDDILENADKSNSIDRTTIPSDSLDVSKTPDKSIKGFSGSIEKEI